MGWLITIAALMFLFVFGVDLWLVVLGSRLLGLPLYDNWGWLLVSEVSAFGAIWILRSAAINLLFKVDAWKRLGLESKKAYTLYSERDPLVKHVMLVISYICAICGLSVSMFYILLFVLIPQFAPMYAFIRDTIGFLKFVDYLSVLPFYRIFFASLLIITGIRQLDREKRWFYTRRAQDIHHEKGEKLWQTV